MSLAHPARDGHIVTDVSSSRLQRALRSDTIPDINHKGDVFVITIKPNATQSIEASMYQAHGVTFRQYCNELETRMEVEQLREDDYKKSNEIVSAHERQSHKT